MMMMYTERTGTQVTSRPAPLARHMTNLHHDCTALARCSLVLRTWFACGTGTLIRLPEMNFRVSMAAGWLSVTATAHKGTPRSFGEGPRSIVPVVIELVPKAKGTVVRSSTRTCFLRRCQGRRFKGFLLIRWLMAAKATAKN